MWAIWEVSEVIGSGFHTARLCAIELASCNASCVSRLHGAVKRVDKRTVRSVIIISVDLLGIGLPWARFLHPSMQVVGFEKLTTEGAGKELSVRWDKYCTDQWGRWTARTKQGIRWKETEKEAQWWLMCTPYETTSTSSTVVDH
jgi:hypothetical protein